MKIQLPKEITREEGEELFNMLFGIVPTFSRKKTMLTIDNPTEQMEWDSQMIVDVLRREMGLPVVDEEEVEREVRAARIRKVTDDTGITLKTEDLKDAIRALAERTGVELS